MKESELVSKEVKTGHYFFLNPSASKNKELRIVFGGIETCTPTYTIQRDNFDFYSIEWIKQGKGSIQIEGETHTLTSGSLFIYGPNTKYKMNTDPKQVLQKYFITFSGSNAKDLLQKHNLKEGSIINTLPHPDLIHLWDKIIEEGNQIPNTQAICQSYLEIFLHKSRNMMQIDKPKDHQFEEYVSLRSYIEDNHLELTSVNEIAKNTKKTPFHICRLFKKYSKESAYNLLSRLKMNYAADLILSTDMRINEIAFQVKFEDPYHFSRVFKKIYGISPAKLKKHYNESHTSKLKG